MWLVKGAPNLMQRLSRLPPVPNVTLLDRRKPKSLSWPHANTTFTQQTYIRWCCIDLSNAPVLMVKYSVESTKVIAKEVHFVPIEFLSWNCLTIGALGWGHIKIRRRADGAPLRCALCPLTQPYRR